MTNYRTNEKTSQDTELLSATKNVEDFLDRVQFRRLEGVSEVPVEDNHTPLIGSSRRHLGGSFKGCNRECFRGN